MQFRMDTKRKETKMPTKAELERELQTVTFERDELFRKVHPKPIVTISSFTTGLKLTEEQCADIQNQGYLTFELYDFDNSEQCCDAVDTVYPVLQELGLYFRLVATTRYGTDDGCERDNF